MLSHCLDRCDACFPIQFGVFEEVGRPQRDDMPRIEPVMLGAGNDGREVPIVRPKRFIHRGAEIGTGKSGASFDGKYVIAPVSEANSLVHEGVGFGYRRDDVFAVEGSPALTSTYLGTAMDEALRPYDWYLATVIAGAEHHRLDAGHIVALRTTHFLEDTELDRKTRVAAIEAMREHGVEDYRKLLEGLG